MIRTNSRLALSCSMFLSLCPTAEAVAKRYKRHRAALLSITGIFLVTFVRCMRVLLWAERHFKPLSLINKKMLIAALLMFTFATMDVAFHLRHNLEAFVYFNSESPIETFDKTSNWINVMKMACYVAQTFVGDAILVSDQPPQCS